jgi:uncharacterized protein (TIGR03435 family)
MRNINLSGCIQLAYDVRPNRVSGAGWLREERYDISAKAEVPAKLDRLRVMLQSLLADRFPLALHRQARELLPYVLLEGKNGNKLHPSEGEGEPVLQGGKLNLKAEKMPLSRFTEQAGDPPPDLAAIPRKMPIELLIVDQAEKVPTEN